VSKPTSLALPALILFLALGVLALGWFTGARSSDTPVLEQATPILVDTRPETVAGAPERSVTPVEQDLEFGRRAFSALDGMADGIELSGRLIDGQSGSAVAGGEVSLVNGEREAHATSAEDGTFTLAWPRDDPAALAIVHPRYVDQRRPRVEFAPGLEIALVRSGSVEGRVRSGPGVDLAAGEVGLWVHTGQKTLGQVLEETSLDSSGRFGFEDLAPGLYTVGVHMRDGPLRIESGFSVSAGLATPLELDLRQGLTVRGRVLVRGSLEPVADAAILARPDLQGVSSELEEEGTSEVVSAGDGTFEVSGLASGRVNVRVRTPWGSALWRQLAVSEASAGRVETFVAAGPAFLSGVVVDSKGEPVAGASVALAREAEVRNYNWARFEDLRQDLDIDGLRTTQTDGRGRFDLGAVPADERLQLGAYPPGNGADSGDAAAGFERKLKLREGEVRTGLVLELVRVLPLGGTVVDDAGGGIPGATVELRIRAGSDWSFLGEAQSDTDGRFLFEAVPEGRVQLEAEVEGHQAGRVSLALPGDGEPIEIELGQAFVIAGTVVDPDGWAVPGAYVRARRAAGEEEQRERKTRWQATDEFGRFSITGLEEGLWTVDGWAPNHRVAEGSEVTVLLPSEAQVLLTLEPRPVPESATITGELALRGSGLPLAGLRLEGARGASVTLEGTRFRITGVRPGRLRLTAKAPGIETVVYDPLQPAPGARIDLGRYEVQRTSNVGVRVLDPDGKVVLGATVRLQRKAGRIAADQAESAAAGVRSRAGKVRMPYNKRFKVYGSTGVVRGTWELKVSHKGWTTVKRDVTIAKVTEVLTVNLTPRGKQR